MKGKKIFAALGVTAAVSGGAALLHSAIKKYLLKVPLDREPPPSTKRSRESLTGSKDFLEHFAEVERLSETLENSGLEKVRITSHDDLELVGHWYSCENPKRVLIAMHGWRSTWAHDFCTIAPFFHSNDCCVLYPEQRAQGNSEGDYMGFGLLECEDCCRWAKWVADHTNNELPIYLVGVSMGASSVMMASDMEMPERVCGIIADCGFTSPYAIWKHVVESNLHLPFGLYSKAVEDMCRRKLQVLPDERSCPKALAATHLPVLFIHGTEDKFVPVEMSYENYKACASKKRLFVVPGAEHGMSYSVDTAGYEEEVRRFWADCEKK